MPKVFVLRVTKKTNLFNKNTNKLVVVCSSLIKFGDKTLIY